MDNEIINETVPTPAVETIPEEFTDTETEEEEKEVEDAVADPNPSEKAEEDPSEVYLNSLIREERIANEYTEFRALVPGVSVTELPDSVLSSIKSGVPLAAAYALYERRKKMSASAASGVNEKNRELSFAIKNGKTSEAYFSPNEVRQMSASEVKVNYSKILDSMSHWN